MLYLRQYLLLARRSQFIRNTKTNIKQEANPNPSCEFSPGNCLPSSSRDKMEKNGDAAAAPAQSIGIRTFIGLNVWDEVL